MKLKARRTTLACKRNDSGVLVYIPEKAQLSGKKYAQFYKICFNSYSADPISVTNNSWLALNIFLSASTIVIAGTPFTYKMLRSYFRLTTSKFSYHTPEYRKRTADAYDAAPAFVPPAKSAAYLSEITKLSNTGMRSADAARNLLMSLGAVPLGSPLKEPKPLTSNLHKKKGEA